MDKFEKNKEESSFNYSKRLLTYYKDEYRNHILKLQGMNIKQEINANYFKVLEDRIIEIMIRGIRIENPQFTKCTFCGKFMSNKDIEEAKYYDPTSVGDYEPAEPEIVHKKCWEKER